MTPPAAETPESILSFWFEETNPRLWFQSGGTFDKIICERFGAMHKDACEGGFDTWSAHPRHALALIILLDQFSRNIYRDDPRAFAQDEKATILAKQAIGRRFDMLTSPDQCAFFYMPLMHAEDLTDQEECVRLFKANLPGTMNIPFAEEHRDIIRRFGRFPHRNKVLRRKSTPEEIDCLKAGGFNPYTEMHG